MQTRCLVVSLRSVAFCLFALHRPRYLLDAEFWDGANDRRIFVEGSSLAAFKPFNKLRKALLGLAGCLVVCGVGCVTVAVAS